MPTPMERASAHLSKLEAERKAAMELSQEKAEEAKLIKARQEGFKEAMEMLGVVIAAGDSEGKPSKPARGKRRDIRRLVLNELSFSGKPMTTTQIAKAIDYVTGLTEKTLRRMKDSGELMRTSEGRWAIAEATSGQQNGHFVTALKENLDRQLERA
jgi:hypothetical protein